MKKISTLLAAAAMVLAANAQSLTVCDGTDWSSMFPVYGMYVDSEGSTSQMIYPADMLTDLQGKTITQIKFYSDGGVKFSGCTIQLRLLETDETTYEDTATRLEGASLVSATTVGQGLDELTFDFDEPFVYSGANLMVETVVAQTGDYATSYFTGVNTDYNASMVYYNWWWEVSDGHGFLPKATFTFDDAGNTAISNVNTDKPVAAVRYYTLDGKQVSSPSGVTLEVTTYTDGTTSTVKVVK